MHLRNQLLSKFLPTNHVSKRTAPFAGNEELSNSLFPSSPNNTSVCTLWVNFTKIRFQNGATPVGTKVDVSPCVYTSSTDCTHSTPANAPIPHEITISLHPQPHPSHTRVGRAGRSPIRPVFVQCSESTKRNTDVPKNGKIKKSDMNS